MVSKLDKPHLMLACCKSVLRLDVLCARIRSLQSKLHHDKLLVLAQTCTAVTNMLCSSCIVGNIAKADLGDALVVLHVQCVLAAKAVLIQAVDVPRLYIDIIKTEPLVSRPCKTISRPNLHVFPVRTYSAGLSYCSTENLCTQLLSSHDSA